MIGFGRSVEVEPAETGAADHRRGRLKPIAVSELSEFGTEQCRSRDEHETHGNAHRSGRRGAAILGAQLRERVLGHVRALLGVLELVLQLPVLLQIDVR